MAEGGSRPADLFSEGKKMKIRMLALAGVAAVSLAVPAHAATEGWYLGLAGGYDNMPNVTAHSGPSPALGVVKMSNSDSGIGVLALGYSWAGGFRIEDEIGYTSHDASTAGFGGSSSVTSDMLNLVYDIPLGDMWKLSLGGGLGAGNTRIHWTTGGLDYVKGSHVALQYQ